MRLISPNLILKLRQSRNLIKTKQFSKLSSSSAAPANGKALLLSTRKLSSAFAFGGSVGLGIIIGYRKLINDDDGFFPVVQAEAQVDTKRGGVGDDKREGAVQKEVGGEGDESGEEESAAPADSKLLVESDEDFFDWEQLLSIVSPYWKRMLIAVGSALVVAAINIQIPANLGKLVDVVTSHLMTTMGGGGAGDAGTQASFVEKLKEPATKLVLLYVAQALSTMTYIYNLSIVGESLALELRTRLFQSLLNQPVQFFDSHMTGEIVSRLTADIQEFKSSFKQCVSQGLRSVSQVLGCVVSLYFVSKEMTLGVCLVIPAVILVGSLFTRGLRVLSRAVQGQHSISSSHASETISNIRTVKAFAMETQELSKYKSEVEELRTLNIQLGIGIAFFQGGSNLFLNGIVLGVMYTGAKLINSNKLSSGDLMSFLVASQTIQRSLANMSLLFGQFVRGYGAGGRVFQYINLSCDDLKSGSVIPNLKGDIEFENVSFSYPTRPNQPILQNFSLKIPQNRMVAVVGASGSGKSTLANLIEGFYPIQPQSNGMSRLTIDSHPIESINKQWLRGEAIGLINQEPVLFATSVMENIRYGKPSATDEEVFEAARKANAYDFVMGFPRGFDTVLGERGVTVSGGQKQRIAIARALIKSPKILILDEATSALDADSERTVQLALDSAVQGRTVLVIAHRLSTVKNADVIAVVSHGRIVEMGPHETLMNRKGFYYNLVKQQEFLSNNKS